MCDIYNFFGNAAGSKLFLSEQDSDVSFCVEWREHRWHFPAHRLILSSMSEVFRNMFKGDMLERAEEIITIKDNSPFTVKRFLKYLYLGALDFNNWIEAIDLLKMAHKYGVHTLISLCESHLISVISFSNVCNLYEIARTYSLETLKKDASSFILDTAFIVTSTEGFFNLMPKSVEFFLRCSNLNMENECCILATLKEWAAVECCRKGIPLVRENVLSTMEPFMQHIKWELIPKELRTFVPNEIVEKYARVTATFRRKPFNVPQSLLYQISILKLTVELGNFHESGTCDFGGLRCLKFGVDNHVFLVGFRILGMFRISPSLAFGPSSLVLERDGNRSCMQFILNSLNWTKGAIVGEYMWREMIVYLPQPVRIDPFSNYVISLKNGSRTDAVVVKWPVTSIECAIVHTDLGPLNFYNYSACYGITQLFLLPAPPFKNACNNDS